MTNKRNENKTKAETFMTRIEALEEHTINKINDLIADCVNETGRDFPWILVEQKTAFKLF